MEGFQENPRVRYHPIPDTIEVEGSSVTSQQLYEMGNLTILDEVYMRFMYHSLAQRIKNDFGPHLPVRVRGTAMNIGENGISTLLGKGKPTRRDKVHYIKTIDEVLRDGTEGTEEFTRTTEFQDGWDFHGMSMLHSFSHSRTLREEVGIEQRQFLFPSMIVYEGNDSPSHQYHLFLPSSLEDKANFILGIYVLDYLDKSD